MKQKKTHRLREWTYSYLGELWEEGIIREFKMDIYTLLYLKIKIDNQQGHTI